jgi:hypothetical protein
VNIEPLLNLSVEKVFSLLKDLVGLGIYYREVPGVSGSAVYDTHTGIVTASPGTVISDVRMILTSVQVEELVGSTVAVTDVKLLVPAADLPFQPRATDTVLLKGVRYNIVFPKPIPGNALHILYCRAA